MSTGHAAQDDDKTRINQTEIRWGMGHRKKGNPTLGQSGTPKPVEPMLLRNARTRSKANCADRQTWATTRQKKKEISANEKTKHVMTNPI
jgi:hypothetical protein